MNRSLSHSGYRYRDSYRHTGMEFGVVPVQYRVQYPGITPVAPIPFAMRPAILLCHITGTIPAYMSFRDIYWHRQHD